MRQRHKSLKRLLHVKNQLHQKEEAELAEIQRQKSEIEAERRAVFDILGGRDDPFILGLACRHLIQTQRRESELARARAGAEDAADAAHGAEEVAGEDRGGGGAADRARGRET